MIRLFPRRAVLVKSTTSIFAVSPLAGVTSGVRCGAPADGTGLRPAFAKLPYTCGRRAEFRGRLRHHRGGGFLAVKKLIVLAVLGLGAFAVWRKVQSDRAELDLWTEATTADED
jgi:hypothetical protein